MSIVQKYSLYGIKPSFSMKKRSLCSMCTVIGCGIGRTVVHTVTSSRRVICICEKCGASVQFLINQRRKQILCSKPTDM